MGIIGMGGAGFPAWKKLEASVEAVIANGAECEPLIYSDQEYMRLRPDLVVNGLKIAMEATGASRAYIALKEKYGPQIEALQPLISDDPRIKLHFLRDVYPIGDEQTLVYDVLRRVVPQGGIPTAVGALVHNVATLGAISEAVCDGTPLTRRLITIGGNVPRRCALDAPTGTLVSDLLEATGNMPAPGNMVMIGGAMMGKVLTDLDTPVGKRTSGILVLPDNGILGAELRADIGRLKRIAMHNCCQCSLCTDICPRGLLGHRISPHIMMRSIGYSRNDGLDESLFCCECGVCSLVACPMFVFPRRIIREMKKYVGKPSDFGVVKEYRPHPFIEYRGVPAGNLKLRLDIARYDEYTRVNDAVFRPDRVEIPLDEAVGAPAEPVAAEGQTVEKGTLIADAPKDGQGVPVHASISGRITSVSSNRIVIERVKR